MFMPTELYVTLLALSWFKNHHWETTGLQFQASMSKDLW